MKKYFQGFYTAYVILLFVATLFVVLPFYLLLSLLPQPGKAYWRLTHLWARAWSLLAGMRPRIYGSWPAKESSYVIVANHVSYIDPVALFAVVPFVFRPLAKSEIARAPLFGLIYARIAILVDRSSVRKKAESMRQLQAVLQSGTSIFVYPEGTFNETEAPTLPFYDGAFRLAIEHQVPVLPIVFPDTKNRWHYSAWWKLSPGKNRVYVLDPVSVKGMQLNDVAALRDKVRQRIDDVLLASG
jgi:1-acyl-sn-glycerol-3-phosphate acyltransferase